MSDKLNVLAGKIKAEAEKVVASFRTALGHARQVGQLLREAKPLVKKAGEEFGSWVEANCTFCKRNAQHYMRIAKHWDTLQQRPDFDSLTIKKALSVLVAKPKDKAESEKPKAENKDQGENKDRPVEVRVEGREYTLTLKPGVSLDLVLNMLNAVAEVKEVGGLKAAA